MSLDVARVAAAMLCAEALFAAALGGAVWLVRPDLVQSRAVVGAMIALALTLALDRGLSAAGYPLGPWGQLVVAALGALALAAMVVYHARLRDIPRPEELIATRQSEERAHAVAHAAIAELQAEREQRREQARSSFRQAMDEAQGWTSTVVDLASYARREG